MTIRARLCFGLLLAGLAASAGPLGAAEDTQERQTGQSTPAEEGKPCRAQGNGLEAPNPPADQPLRAADIQPSSWSNVKALWG
jgi:hypothetical protein